MTTIKDYFGVHNVSDLMIGERNYKVSPDYAFSNPNLIVGVELEIEGWNDDNPKEYKGFVFEVDNSLRNNGVEAVTLPMFSKYVPNLLTNFFKTFGITENNYSHRCSTHVHINAQNLHVEQVRSICVLYQALERVILSYVGNDRDNNIFCVPWHQCNISQDFVNKFTQDLNLTTRSWQKYTALNILPLRDRGTLEFRHLEGTCNVARITEWINLIGCIVRYATEVSYETIVETIVNMNTVSNYGAFVEHIFREFSTALTTLPEYEENLALGVVDCKLCLVNAPVATTTREAFGQLFGAAEVSIQRSTLTF